MTHVSPGMPTIYIFCGIPCAEVLRGPYPESEQLCSQRWLGVLELQDPLYFLVICFRCNQSRHHNQCRRDMREGVGGGGVRSSCYSLALVGRRDLHGAGESKAAQMLAATLSLSLSLSLDRNAHFPVMLQDSEIASRPSALPTTRRGHASYSRKKE